MTKATARRGPSGQRIIIGAPVPMGWHEIVQPGPKGSDKRRTERAAAIHHGTPCCHVKDCREQPGHDDNVHPQPAGPRLYRHRTDRPLTLKSLRHVDDYFAQFARENMARYRARDKDKPPLPWPTVDRPLRDGVARRAAIRAGRAA